MKCIKFNCKGSFLPKTIELFSKLDKYQKYKVYECSECDTQISESEYLNDMVKNNMISRDFNKKK